LISIYDTFTRRIGHQLGGSRHRIRIFLKLVTWFLPRNG
jgi:hypothetical protein